MNDNIPLDAGTMADQLHPSEAVSTDPAALPKVCLRNDLKELIAVVEKLGEDMLNEITTSL